MAEPAVQAGVSLHTKGGEQRYELKEALGGGGVVKRKRGGVGGDEEVVGVGASGSGTGEETRGESNRHLKRRSGGGGGAPGAIRDGDVARKRKSLEKIVTEQDLVVVGGGEKSKRRKVGGGGGGGGEEGNGNDAAVTGDEGSKGQGLKIRFTRRGDAFAVSKKGVSGITLDEARNGGSVGNEGFIQDGLYGYEARSVHGDSRRNADENRFFEIHEVNYRRYATGSDGLNPVGKPVDESGTRLGQESYHTASTSVDTGVGEKVASIFPARVHESTSTRDVVNKDVYQVPSYAGWFSWTKIHAIERRSLSEYFDGKSLSKTPKIYKEYRDFIINKYRENMHRSITFTEVRRMLIGDVNSLRRVFEFLDHWGLINHQVLPDLTKQTPSHAPSPTPPVVEPMPRGIHVAFTNVANSSTPRGFQPQSEPVAGRGLQRDNLSTHNNVFSPFSNPVVPANSVAAERSDKQRIETSCSSCGSDCRKLRFHCRDELQAGFDLCSDCFRNDKFGLGMVAKDFSRIEDETKPANKEWTTSESLRLLEAISRFGDNWNQVADHVSTRSRRECVKHFVQLPFGDRFLSDAGADSLALQDRLNSVSSSGKRMIETTLLEKEVLGARAEEPNGIAGVAGQVVSEENGDGDGDCVLPVIEKCTSSVPEVDLSLFADASNPIIAQVAFMSAMVGPRVAAAAAQAAVAAIAEEEPDVAQISSMSGHVQSVAHKDSLLTGTPACESSKDPSKLVSLHQDSPPQQDKDSIPHSLSGPDLDGEKQTHTGKEALPFAAQVRAGIATALGAAAANAKLLADQEEREIEYLMSSIIENQVKRLYAKLAHFEELEMLLEKERVQLEQARQLVYATHIHFAEGRVLACESRQN